MPEEQEDSSNPIPPFQVEYLRNDGAFLTPADKKSEARKKLLSLLLSGWVENAENREFIARYHLDESFMLPITKTSNVCYVDDSFLITEIKWQIYINGKADGPDWTHTFQYATVVWDKPCIVTTTNENRRGGAMHLFYGNDHYDIPNCKYISVSPNGAVWWIDIRGNEFRTTLHDLVKKTPISQEKTKLPDNLAIISAHISSDDTEIILGTQPGDQKRDLKLFKDGTPMDIREFSSIKEIKAYSFEKDTLYIKYTDFSNAPFEININFLSDRQRKDENNPAVHLHRKINNRLCRIVKEMRWKNEEWFATIEKQQEEIKELREQMVSMKREMKSLEDKNNKLTMENTAIKWLIDDIIHSLATALRSHKMFAPQLPATVKRLIQEHADRKKTDIPPIS